MMVVGGREGCWTRKSVMAFSMKRTTKESGVLYGLSSQKIGMHVKDTYTTAKNPIAETIER